MTRSEDFLLGGHQQATSRVAFGPELSVDTLSQGLRVAPSFQITHRYMQMCHREREHHLTRFLRLTFQHGLNSPRSTHGKGDNPVSCFSHSTVQGVLWFVMARLSHDGLLGSSDGSRPPLQSHLTPHFLADPYLFLGLKFGHPSL